MTTTQKNKQTLQIAQIAAASFFLKMQAALFCRLHFQKKDIANSWKRLQKKTKSVQLQTLKLI